jgi:hypothetical protein
MAAIVGPTKAKEFQTARANHVEGLMAHTAAVAGNDQAEGAGSRPCQGKEPPGPFDTFQRLAAPVFQDGVGPDDQVPHRPRGQDLIGPGRPHHPGCDVHGDAADIAVAQLDLAGVEPGPNPEPDAAQFVSEGGCAADSPTGAVEGGQDPSPVVLPAGRGTPRPAGRPVRRAGSATGASADPPAASPARWSRRCR